MEQNFGKQQMQASELEVTIPASLLKILPTDIKFEVEALSPGKKAEFIIRYISEIKNQNTLVLLFLLSFHYLYLNNWKLQILYWLTGGGFGFWTLLDLFRLSNMLREYNNTLAEKTLEIVKNNLY